MAFARYYNTPGMTQPRLLGSFDVGKICFEYSNRPRGDRGNVWPGFPHRVFTTDGDRAALVLKTVAHIVIDEDADGNPIFEVWKIKNPRTYPSPPQPHGD